MNKLKKVLLEYYSNVGEIEVYNDGHKEMMILIRPLLKIVERISKEVDSNEN